MNRNSTLIVLLSLLASAFCNSSLATVYIDNGTNTDYNLAAGDSLYIASGNYTGNITGFATGAKIAVASGAVFQPTSFASPNMHGTLYVYGTFKYSSATQLKTNSNFTLHNYGTVWITSSVQMNGNDQVWNNYFNATIKMDADVDMTNNNAINNQGFMTFGANLTMTGTTSITNKNTITVAGNYVNNGGTFINQGKFETTGYIWFKNGQALIYNYCRMISNGGITNTSGYVYNYSFMWAKSSLGQGNIVNSGSIYNGPIARIQAANFTNTGTVTGAGYLYFTGTTTTTGVGTTGVIGITTDTIRIYDVSRANPLTIYDNQLGIVNPNVVYRSFAAPDSLMAYIPGCSVEMISQIPLAVKWDYFFVTLSENIPALTWSAEYEQGTVFEIQRSYDGINFYNIKNVNADNSKSAYGYNDNQVNAKVSIVYYRINATTSKGSQKYSETRTAKFSNKSGITIQTAPNPFTSNFTINYQTTEQGIITVRVFNMSGQQQFAKNAMANNGLNSFTITEAAKLVKGFYLVQISRDNKLISTEKIIKQ